MLPTARLALTVTSLFIGGTAAGYSSISERVVNSIRENIAPTPSAHVPAAGAPAAPRASVLPVETDALRVLGSAEYDAFPDPAITLQQRGACGRDSTDVACQNKAAPSAMGQTGVLAGLRLPDFPIHANWRLERYVRYMTESTRGRDLFRGWLKRSGRHREIVARALRERGLPPDLQAVVFAESGFSPTAVSTAGAVGLWQLMSGTARIYGLTVEEDFDERRSVAKSSEVATRHLSDLYERFGTWDLVFAAYDMGYGGLVKRIRELSTNDFWEIAQTEGALPREVVLYVPKVQAIAIILRNLNHFGFDDVEIDSPVRSSNLVVPPRTSLTLVARAAGTSLERIHRLNPEILSGFAPDRSSDVSVHVPPEGLARARTMLPRLLVDRSDKTELDVGDNFDWGRDELPSKHGQGESSPLGTNADVDNESPNRNWKSGLGPSLPVRSKRAHSMRASGVPLIDAVPTKDY